MDTIRLHLKNTDVTHTHSDVEADEILTTFTAGGNRLNEARLTAPLSVVVRT